MINKVKIILFVFIATITILGCSSADENTVVSSDFEASFIIEQNENDLLVNQEVKFISNSTIGSNEVVYFWEFGDGESSTLQSPTHIYSTFGIYPVKLTISLGNKTDSFSKEITISLSNIISGRNTLSEKLTLANNKILVCAHRGSHENVPENSLASISEAITNNISMVELDVRQTKDGILVLIHDSSVNRTTNGTGSVSAMTYQELLQFYLKNPDGTLSIERIPTLKQVLELARGNIYINIDVDDQKAPPLKVYQLVKQYGMINQVMFFSSFYSDINSLYQQNPPVIAMPTIYSQNDFITYANSNLNIKVVHYNDSSFTTNLVNQAKAKGWFIFKNAYVLSSTSPNSDAYGQINTMINLGGDIIQTDYPSLTKNYLITHNLY